MTLVGMVGLLCLPPAMVALPPLVDYPNHLVRLWLISGQGLRPPLDTIYVVDWSRAMTNIGIDLLARAFGPAFGAEAVGRTAILLALLLPVLGTLWLGRVVAGRWHAALLAVPAFGWNIAFAAGFMNQQIAIGSALLAAAVTEGMRPWARLSARFGAGLMIAVIHPVGAIFLAGLAAALAIGESRPRPGEWIAAARRACGAGGLVILALVVLAVVAPALPAPQSPDAPQAPAWTYLLKDKVIGTVQPFLAYSLPAGIALAIVSLAMLYWGIRQGELRLHFGLSALAAGLLAASIVLPSSIGDTTQIEFRCTSLALLSVLAALRPRRTPRMRTLAAVMVTFVMLAGMQSAWALSAWRAGSSQIAAVERAVAAMPRGARLLPVDGRDETSRTERPTGLLLALGWPLHEHYGMRAVMLRDAFVPGVFSTDGKQPLRILEPFRTLSAGLREPLSTALLRKDTSRLASFDYVLLLDAGGIDENALPRGLELTADEGFARLYRIVSGAANR